MHILLGTLPLPVLIVSTALVVTVPSRVCRNSSVLVPATIVGLILVVAFQRSLTARPVRTMRSSGLLNVKEFVGSRALTGIYLVTLGAGAAEYFTYRHLAGKRRASSILVEVDLGGLLGAYTT
ncbi:hypothetical protein EDB81DRAFT_802353 [Dactylonectria macrodidyma]|uniref:Uncharacterized protein n=1 Tax=Dactylonectria macrodidyma TaxID=307937 RepID=A0A9P9EG73_9HYPO|nr:hypothetical protein EDB81DRAFT_802353 [Dactylonectria macrodidyma]